MTYVKESLFLNCYSTGVITTVAGDGTRGYSGDGGLATLGALNWPSGVAVDALGNIYIADTRNDRIRMVTKSSGIITTVAGGGTPDCTGDGGQATSAGLSHPGGVAVDASGNIYIVNSYCNRIQMVTKSTSIITTVAGNGTRGYGGDGGLATSARLYYPNGVAVDASGNIYIADTFNLLIRMVTKSTGIITTVAGNRTLGYSGDGGLATSARLHYPYSVVADASGNIYIADIGNHKLRMVTKSTGIITTVAGSGTTVAGNGTHGFRGDGGLATLSRLYNPSGVAVDSFGNIYIADSSNSRIRMVTKSTGIITTVAGNGTHGYSGDGGLAKSAKLNYPKNVAVDASGNLYIADLHRIRVIALSASTPLSSPTPSPLPSSPVTSPLTASPVASPSPSSLSAALVTSASTGLLLKLMFLL
jgi:trimeric autotransporter adhesin